MKISNIESILDMFSDEQLWSFFNNCKITEKLDTHYVKVEIINPNYIVCQKGTGEAVTQADCVLNAMWYNYLTDWAIIKNDLGFKEFAKKYVGCTLCMYYFPCHKPLNTEYEFKSERCYIINYAYDNYNKSTIPLQIVWNDLRALIGITGCNHPDGRYIIDRQKDLSLDADKIHNLLNNISKETFKDDVYNAVILDNTLAKDKTNIPVIFNELKRYYQLQKEITTDSSTLHDIKERTSYEFVLADFVQFFNENNMSNKIRGSYISIVCQLFNDYIIKREKITGHIRTNINPEAIQSPHIGYNHGDTINYKWFPNALTAQLCNEDILYRNIFKLLLANLRVYKNKKYCVYLNNAQIGALNNIVYVIELIKQDAPIAGKKLKSKKYKYNAKR